MANIYDVKHDERNEKEDKKWEMKHKVVSAFNPLKIISGMADVTEKTFDVVINLCDSVSKKLGVSDKDLEKIKSEYNGSNIAELSKKYGYSEKVIREALNK